VALFAPPAGPGVRNDAGLESGDEVTVHYDPMLAKLIVHAPDRAAAIARLRRALDDYAVLGVTTNLPLLRAIAAHPAFAAGATHTDFLSETGLAGASFDPPALPHEALAAAVIMDLEPPIAGHGGTALQGLYDSSSVSAPISAHDPWAAGPWRLLRDGLRLRYTLNGDEHSATAGRAADRWRVEIGETTLVVGIIARQQGWLTLEFDGARVERFAVAREGGETLIGWRGGSFRLARAAALSVDRLGGRHSGAHGHASLEAPMPGAVVKVLAGEGQAVAAHQPLIVLEAMKMEHIVAAPYDGVVRKLLCAPGALVAKGAALLELDEA
jgi:3-methylcrotonyl-CoA carboxylase alpha subunit